MANPEHIAIEVTLIESGGPLGTVGEPRLFCRYSAVHLPGTHLDGGRASVVVRESETRQWREYTRQTGLDEARSISTLLEVLGIPGRRPEVVGVVDTSDGWANLYLRAKWERGETSLDIGMQSSGFEGPDAERLRTLFRALFALAGFEGYCPVVYGPRQAR